MVNLSKIKNIIKRNIKNIPGRKTKRKIVVIYADDFGGIRVKNKEAFNLLKSKGIPMDSSRFTKHDTLASKEDLLKLFEVLKTVKDFKGNNACLTPFVNVANPDFNKIKESGFQEYYREPFTKTLKKYGDKHTGVFDLWMQGVNENIFYPAFHGTEHINVKRFMEALKNGHKSSRAAFEVESVCVPSFPDENPIKNSTTTYFIEETKENDILAEEIKLGTELFEKLFGYRSKQFTPGAGIYNPYLHKTLYDSGIEYINVSRFKNYPLGNAKYVKKFISNGQSNEIGQKFIVRNCVFEPSGSDDFSIALKCLKDVAAAFFWGAPAIISTHRVNFIGHFDKQWRDNSLNQLEFLLRRIKKAHPSVEFLNGDDMAKEIFE